MGSQSNLCRLCVTSCEDYKSLYTANGQADEAYHLMLKYFDIKPLNKDKGKLDVLCMLCWGQILNFYNFQQFVYEAQKKLQKDHVDHVDVVVKKEFDVEESAGDPNEFPTASSVNVSTHQNKSYDNVVQGEDENVLCVPKLEIMDVFPGEGSDEDTLPDLGDDYTENVQDDKLNDLDDTMGGMDVLNEILSSENETEIDNKNIISTSESKAEPNVPLDYDEDDDVLIARWKPLIECAVCLKAYPSFMDLEQHFLNDHPFVELYVMCCRRRLNTKSALVEHVRRHIFPDPYRCRLCGKRFRNKRSYVRHMYSHPSNESTKNGYAEIDNLIAQWKGSLKCALCSQAYPAFQFLQHHFRTSHPGKKFHIDCCGRKLRCRTDIESHLSIHIDPDMFKCEICYKRYTSQKNLDTHKLLRHKDMTKEFNDSDPLANLETTLDGIIAQWKPKLECELCNVSCDTFTTLQEHFSQQHPQETCYFECCQRKLSEPLEIKDHMHLHSNPEAYKCTLCDKCFENQDDLIRHAHGHQRRTPRQVTDQDIEELAAQAKIHLKCPVCMMAFTSMTLLRTHFAELHPEDGFQVLCCDLKIKERPWLEEHLRWHIDPNVFKCEFCEKRFGRRLYLDTHQSKYHNKEGPHTSTNSEGKGPKQLSDIELDEFVFQLKTELQCGVCCEMIKSVTLLRQHFGDVHPQDGFHVYCCKRKMSAPHVIKEHFVYHLNPNIFKCELCDKSFRRQSYLKQHQGSHNPKKSDKKKEPTKIVKSKEELDEFVAKWKTDLECVVCKGSYSTYSLLRQHFRQMHPFKMFYIPCCGRKIKTRYTLNEHIRYHLDPDIFKCKVCGKNHSNRYLFLLHKRKHPLCGAQQ